MCTAPSESISGHRPGAPSVSSTSDTPVNACEMLRRREQNSSRLGRFSKAECCHVAQRYLPSGQSTLIDQMHSKAYIGQFTKNGDFFVGAYQHNSVRIYEVRGRLYYRILRFGFRA